MTSTASSPRGLVDAIYTAYVKLLGHDLLHTVQRHAQFHDLYVLHGRPIRGVHIVGTIVSVRQRPKFNEYIVDDGTGLVVCIQWLRLDNAALGTVPTGQTTVAQLGAIVSVRGRLHVYNDQRQITVELLATVLDPNLATLHWLEAINQTRQIRQ